MKSMAKKGSAIKGAYLVVYDAHHMFWCATFSVFIVEKMKQTGSLGRFSLSSLIFKRNSVFNNRSH